MRYLVVLAVIGTLLFAAWQGVQAWVASEVRLQVAEKANEVTNATLDRIAGDVRKAAEGTARLNQDVSELSDVTRRGLSGVRREMANAKTITLSDPLPGAVAESLCVQYHKANSGNALHGKTLSGAVLRLPADTFAKRCGSAWARVTWGAVIEWIFPLMEHDGGLQLQLEAGRRYYGGGQ